MFGSALAAATAATMAITVGASGAMAATSDTSDTYVARVAAHGVDGNITVALDPARTGGTVEWTLNGLDNGAVTIRMQGGTCAEPTDWVGTTWTRDAVFKDGTGTRTHELLSVSAKAFASDIASKQGVTATFRNNDQLIACIPFTDHV